MDMFDFAGLLFGGSRTAPDATTVTATGAGASADGEVGITLDADVTPAEDTGVEVDADQTIIDLPTSPDVAEGDELIVTLVGDGPLKTPVVTANPGSGDRMRTLVNAAQTVADAAQAVAEAVNQHFWHDDSGAHVTMATQDEWEQYHSGPNSLWNALGMLFRDGLNNLLAIVTNGIAIYDGNGNEDGNILAKFYTFVRNENQHARVDFFNGKGFIDYDSELNTLHISARDDSTDSVVMNTARINLYQSTDNTISNLELLAGANYGAPPAFIQLDSRNPSDGSPESTIYAYASDLLLGYYGGGGSTTIPMQQAINVLSSPVTLFTGTYAQTHSVAVTLSETAANFSRMLVEWETADGNQGSTMLSNPNGKRFEAVAINCNSATNPVTFIKWKVFVVNGTLISNYNPSNGSFQRGEVVITDNASPRTARSECIGIIRVLGWR